MLQAERDDWNVSYELGDAWENARKIKLKNSSLFKIDVLVYPEFSFKNVIITQIYQVLFESCNRNFVMEGYESHSTSEDTNL